MKDILVSREDIRRLHPIFRGKYGEKIIDFGFKISALHIPNEIYNRSKHLNGHAFCKDVLDRLGIIRTVRNGGVLDDFKEKSFITVSNHAYGHIDGIAVIETVGSRVENYRMMVNVFLSLIDTMADNFISVNPMKNSDKKGITYAGIRESFAHLKKDHSLGFFPAGAVSNMHLKRGRLIIEDQQWQPAALKIIQKAKVPVIPIHISGHNSWSFYFSKIIGWQVRNLRLCHELYNKSGKEMVITLGDPIMPREFEQFEGNIPLLGEYLKGRTYLLGGK